MVVGWIDDVIHPLTYIRIISQDWQAVVDVSRIVRVRRMDVETPSAVVYRIHLDISAFYTLTRR